MVKSFWIKDLYLFFLLLFRYITWVEKSEEQLEQEKKDRKKNKMLRDDEEITQKYNTFSHLPKIEP